MSRSFNAAISWSRRADYKGQLIRRRIRTPVAITLTKSMMLGSSSVDEQYVDCSDARLGKLVEGTEEDTILYPVQGTPSMRSAMR